MKKENTIIFVYNVDSSVFNELTDYAHKLISPDTYQCNLCKLTYGNLGMRQEWREFVKTLPYAVQFSHKDEFIRQNKEFTNIDFPAVFINTNNTIKQLITTQEINRRHTLDELKTLVIQKTKGE